MENEAIAIIGGADGPTAIFVAGSDIGWLIGLCAVLAAAVLLWLLLRKKRGKKTDA